jgi:hypothetical protein
MTTGSPFGGLGAAHELQTIEFGLICFPDRHILNIIMSITSLCVEMITIYFHLIVDLDSEGKVMSELDGALVSAQFPCLRTVRFADRGYALEVGVRAFGQERLPKCHRQGLLYIQ